MTEDDAPRAPASDPTPGVVAIFLASSVERQMVAEESWARGLAARVVQSSDDITRMARYARVIVLDGPREEHDTTTARTRLDLIHTLRSENAAVPIVVFTELSALDSCLRMGASQCVAPPIEPMRVGCQLAVAVHTSRSDVQADVHLGPLQLGPGEESYVAGNPVALTQLEVDVLRYLYRRAPEAVSNDAFYAVVLQRKCSPRRLAGIVKSIRDKLGRVGVGRNEVIVNVWGRGYKLNPNIVSASGGRPDSTVPRESGVRLTSTDEQPESETSTASNRAGGVVNLRLS